jgi:hypothetical protein
MGRFLDTIKKSGNGGTPYLQNLQNQISDSSVGFVGSSPAHMEIIDARNEGVDIDFLTAIFSPETTQPDPDPYDDRRTCRQCANLRGAVCSVARPGGIVSAKYGYTPSQVFKEEPHRCEGYAPRL